MIKFNPSKAKTISFDIDITGIDPKLLEYNLRLSSKDIHYGFSGKNDRGSIVFEIPPLNNIMNHDLIEEISNVKLEVNDKNNKYYIKPYEDDVKIKTDPIVEVKIQNDIEEKIEEKVKVKVSVKENDSTIKTNVKKNSKIGKFINS